MTLPEALSTAATFTALDSWSKLVTQIYDSAVHRFEVLDSDKVAGIMVGRFLVHRLAGLRDKPRPGIKRKITDERVAQVVRRTLEEKPPDATHWSTRSMAAASGISRSSVSTIWRAFNLQPHRSETFKLSTDPKFVEKVRDIVGLYMSPPRNPVVICVDEKSQMQALDRTQPLLPMRPGTPERRTHDYHRHGTSSLFAGLMVKTGVVIRECHRRHRHQEFLRFLNTIDRVVKTTEPDGTAVHIVLDNYATHKTPAVQRWLGRHPEYQLHFTPTSARSEKGTSIHCRYSC